MTFAIDTKSGLCDDTPDLYRRAIEAGRPRECAIIAEGIIGKDTVDKFRDFVAKQTASPMTVLFNSGGGDLEAGYQLGRAIREASLDTGIASVYVPAKLPEYCAHLSTDQNRYSGESGEVLRSFEEITCRYREGAMTEEFGYCLSACAFAYLGGVVRTLPRNLNGFTVVSAVGLDNESPPPIAVGKRGQVGETVQAVLGFHPFKPDARLDLPANAKEEQISSWAQRQFPGMLRFLSDMGYSNELQIIQFVADGGSGRIRRESSPFKYPSLVELRAAGILSGGIYLPLRLVAEKEGAALISSFSDGLLPEKQISLICARIDQGAPKLALIVSGGRDQQRRVGPAPVVSVAGLGGLASKTGSGSGHDANGQPVGVLRTTTTSNPAEQSWRIVLKIDGATIFDGGQYESHPPSFKGPDGQLNPLVRQVTFDVNDGMHYSSQNSAMPIGRDLEHFLVLIDIELVQNIKRGRHLTIEYSMYDGNVVDFEFGSDFTNNLDLLFRECLSISVPKDKANGYYFGI